MQKVSLTDLRRAEKRRGFREDRRAWMAQLQELPGFRAKERVAGDDRPSEINRDATRAQS